VSSDDEIRRLFDRWAEAIRTKDAGESLSHYSSTVIAFDLLDPLRYVGSDSVRNRLDDWFSSFDGPIDFENHDLSVTSSDDVAFAHSLNHVGGKLRDGGTLDMYWRATVCLRKINGDWAVVHTHTSVPFNMRSGKASLDLAP
jgi:ketosteroid isomerase-like protein